MLKQKGLNFGENFDYLARQLIRQYQSLTASSSLLIIFFLIHLISFSHDVI